jgi:UDP-MurNAc hydroxylase
VKLDFLGHASLVLRSGDVALLFDPLLFGVHHEGLYDLYPPRQLHLDRLPSIDAVVITHAHRDHFDLESIARLDRSTPIFAADDPLLLGCLTGLGFEQVQPLANWAPITAGAATLTPTPPADGAIEHGFIVQEDGVTLWHLVDTFPSAATIAEVKRRFGAVDLLIAPWQPLQDATFPSGNPVVFPYEMYRAILANILQIAPRALIPGACGFRAIGPAAWTNHLIFPVTRARFLHDVAVAAPQLAGRTHVMEPGDALNLAPGVFAREQGLLDYCVADPADYRWEQLQFRPYELGHPVLEPRGDAFTREQCHAALADFFAELARAAEEDPEAYFWHRRWQVTRQYEVVFAGGDRAYWLLDLRGEAPQISEQRSPLALAHTVLPASLLIGLIAGTISWEYAVLSGELRQHDHTYRVDDAGLHLPPRRLVDPLARALGGHDAEEHHLALCVERLTAELEDAPVMRTDQGSRAPARDSAAVMGQILTALADAGLDLNKHGE